LAFLNPVKAGTTDATLSISNEVTAEDYFAEKQFYIVVDAGLAKDIEANMVFKGDFEFELTYK
jgi:ABC-type molybdate transport system substrate-binding protein